MGKFAFVGAKPRVSDADIDAIEEALGFVLPDDLRQHYLTHNGGQPTARFFRKNDEIFAIEEFLPIKFGMRGERLEDAYEDIVVGNDLFPQGLIPFANDAGGDYFCYSLRNGEEGAIVFYQSEYFDDPERSVVFLSKSFQDFLSALVDVE